MDTEKMVRLLQSEEIDIALTYAKSTQRFTELQLKWIKDRITGFVAGRPVDDYQVMACWSTEQLSGFLIYRKRPLTQSVFEIGQLVVSQKDSKENVITLVNSLTNIAKKDKGSMIFIELLDSPTWKQVQTILIECGFSTVGQIPHLFQPGLGAIYFEKRL